MDKLIEKIYNTYLKTSRTQNNKPFRYRQNFEGFEKEPNYLPALKLKSFFTRNPQIKIEDYFIAPYIIFENDKEAFYDLNFYNSLQAIKVYTLYSKRCMNEDPDSDFQLQKITDGLKYIKEFCLEKKIPLSEYLRYKSANVNDFLVHLSHKNISIYNLFPLRNLDRVLRSYDFELLSFILNDLASRISYFRTKFLASKKAKALSVAGLTKIEKNIKKQLDIN
jgi:hypothetical protein